jgi:hypothetical protein
VLLEPRLGELKENKLELLPGREPDRALLELAPRLDEPEEKLLPGRLAEELLPRPLKLKLLPPLGLELPMLLLEKLGIDGALREADELPNSDEPELDPKLEPRLKLGMPNDDEVLLPRVKLAMETVLRNTGCMGA